MEGDEESARLDAPYWNDDPESALSTSTSSTAPSSTASSSFSYTAVDYERIDTAAVTLPTFSEYASWAWDSLLYAPFQAARQSPMPQYPNLNARQSPLPLYPNARQSPLPYSNARQSPLPYSNARQSPLPYISNARQSPLPYSNARQSPLPYSYTPSSPSSPPYALPPLSPHTTAGDLDGETTAPWDIDDL